MKNEVYKALIILVGVLFYHTAVNAQNLLNMQGWTVGQGSSGMFNSNGLASENSREWGEGPDGKRAILWKATPNGDGQQDGGWNSQYFSIVHTNMYRFTVWIKKTNSKDGSSYFGCRDVLNLDGTPNTNPYFWSGDLPELDKWYLLVAYVHGSNDPSTASFGGIYDGVTGKKVANCTDFKFAEGATATYHRSYLYYDANTSDRQYFYAPRVDLVNGNEPGLLTLLGLESVTSNQGYFAGKVGIKTTNPGDYDLAVNGKIRSKEIKVEVANWPDYVFSDGYKMLPLPELEKYINEHKHLPSIPAARQMESEGVALGEINKKLLEKLEEITLHLINLDKRLRLLEEKGDSDKE